MQCPKKSNPFLKKLKDAGAAFAAYGIYGLLTLTAFALAGVWTDDDWKGVPFDVGELAFMPVVGAIVGLGTAAVVPGLRWERGARFGAVAGAVMLALGIVIDVIAHKEPGDKAELTWAGALTVLGTVLFIAGGFWLFHTALEVAAERRKAAADKGNADADGNPEAATPDPRLQQLADRNRRLARRSRRQRVALAAVSALAGVLAHLLACPRRRRR